MVERKGTFLYLTDKRTAGRKKRNFQIHSTTVYKKIWIRRTLYKDSGGK